MKPTPDSTRPPAPGALADLFRAYLERQTTAQAEGLGYAESADEVVPHEAVPVQPVDPRRAWDDARAVVAHLGVGGDAALPVPPEWPALVAAQEPAVAVAFCLGNYPQLVRNLHPLLGGDPVALRVVPSRPLSAPALSEWARRTPGGPAALLAAGVLRLAGQYEEAEGVLRSADVPAGWRAVRANEEAALAWHRGRAEEALAAWQAQEASVPVLFNRGMAALFVGRVSEARADLTAAVEQLPETSAWYHLGHLYLALAAGRR
jgi:tetratricopeptide (TPR) repeat protein